MFVCLIFEFMHLCVSSVHNCFSQLFSKLLNVHLFMYVCMHILYLSSIFLHNACNFTSFDNHIYIGGCIMDSRIEYNQLSTRGYSISLHQCCFWCCRRRRRRRRSDGTAVLRGYRRRSSWKPGVHARIIIILVVLVRWWEQRACPLQDASSNPAHCQGRWRHCLPTTPIHSNHGGQW